MKRLSWIDGLKGLAMLLVIAGHSGIPTGVTAGIYVFHMPLFFFISGYLEKEACQPWKQEISKRARRLLIPYGIYGVVIAIYNTFYYYDATANIGRGILKKIIAIFYGNYIFENNYEYIGTLWFLVCSFCVAVLLCIYKRITWKKYYVIIVGCIGFVLTYIEKKYQIRLPWCADISMVAFLFAVAGLECKKYMQHKEVKTWLSWGFLVVGIVAGIGNLRYMKCSGYEMLRTDMLYLNWGCIPLFLMSAGLISMAMCLLFQKYYKHSIRILEYIGKNSLTIMVLHFYIGQCLWRLNDKFVLHLNGWLIFGLTVLISLLGCKGVTLVGECLRNGKMEHEQR